MSSETIVKVNWKNKNGKWFAQLKTCRKDNFNTIDLTTNTILNIEIKNQRKCTGYAPEKGVRKTCPEKRSIPSGTQCKVCRQKDIYSNYVIGNEKTQLNGNFSVYIAQIGNQIKVGVTRTGRIRERWVEQGADYATQLKTGLEAKEALKVEKKITAEHGIKQRVNKKDKILTPKNPKLIENTLKNIGEENNLIEEIQKDTIYPKHLSNNLKRSGLFKGKIKSVKGKIINNGRLNMVMTPGKVISSPQQNSLDQF